MVKYIYRRSRRRRGRKPGPKRRRFHYKRRHLKMKKFSKRFKRAHRRRCNKGRC